MPNIRDLINTQKALYDSVVSVQCNMLNDVVYFRSEGFHHLINKSQKKRRKVSEQYLKLMCFTHAAEIVKDCNKIIETRSEERIIKGKKKSVFTYELIDGKTRDANIAVIVERIGTGKLKFKSVKKISKNRYSK